MSKSKRKIRKYDQEFKDRAVKLYYSSDKSYRELGKELGIPAATLSTWVHTSKQSPPKSSKTTPCDDDITKELLKLKRKLAITKEERDILKKALAIFSTDNHKL